MCQWRSGGECVNTEKNWQTERETRPETENAERGHLPFDRREWALMNAEAQDSLRRQYGREARGHADD